MAKKIVINGCSNENFWYSELVGFPELAQFDVCTETDDEYIIKMSNDFNEIKLAVLKIDCLAIM